MKPVRGFVRDGSHFRRDEGSLSFWYKPNPHGFSEDYIVFATDGRLGQQVAEATFVSREERVLDDDGYQVYEPYLDEYAPGEFVERHSPVSKVVALKGWDVWVSPDYRRRGIASKLYKIAEKAYGVPVLPGDFQTPEGSKFLRGRKRG